MYLLINLLSALLISNTKLLQRGVCNISLYYSYQTFFLLANSKSSSVVPSRDCFYYRFLKNIELLLKFGWLIHQINHLYEVFNLKWNFRKNKVVTGKTPFFFIGPFFNIGFWQSSCMEMMRFQSLYFQLKIATPVFCTEFTFFRKFLSKLKYCKRSTFPVIVT